MDAIDQLPAGERVHAACADNRRPTVDVVICAYTREREELLRRAIASAAGQDDAARVIVIIDHNPDLLAALRDGPELDPLVEIHANTHEQGLSGARNTGLALATAEVVAFLDDDAVAASGWLSAILEAHGDPDLVGTGGLVTPEWECGVQPSWFPDEFLWTVGCSYRGLPTMPGAEIRNPIGANMSFRRLPLAEIGGFRSGLGRIGTTPSGCEETEAAIRVRSRSPRARIVHLPNARVGHFVPQGRARWSYFRRRCVAEGRSKALVAASVGPGGALSSERHYVTQTLPAGVTRGVRAALRGDPAGLVRAAAILAGLTLTGWGYAAGRASARSGPTDTSSPPTGTGLRRWTGALAVGVIVVAVWRRIGEEPR